MWNSMWGKLGGAGVGLAIGGPISETGDNANQGGAVDRAGALPQDAAIQVWFGHRLLGAK